MKPQVTIYINDNRYFAEDILSKKRVDQNGFWVADVDGGELIYKEYKTCLFVKNHGVIKRKNMRHGSTVAMLSKQK